MKIDNLANFMGMIEVPPVAGVGEENTKSATRAFESIMEGFRALLQVASMTAAQQAKISSPPQGLNGNGTPFPLPSDSCNPACGTSVTRHACRQGLLSLGTLEDWNTRPGESSSFKTSSPPATAAIIVPHPEVAFIETPVPEQAAVESQAADIVTAEAGPGMEIALRSSEGQADKSVATHKGDLAEKADLQQAGTLQEQHPGIPDATARANLNTSLDAPMIVSSETLIAAPPQLSSVHVKLPTEPSDDGRESYPAFEQNLSRQKGLPPAAGILPAQAGDIRSYAFPVETTNLHNPFRSVELEAPHADAPLSDTQSAVTARGNSPNLVRDLQPDSVFQFKPAGTMGTGQAPSSLASLSPAQMPIREGHPVDTKNEVREEGGRRPLAGPVEYEEAPVHVSRLDGAGKGFTSLHDQHHRPGNPPLEPVRTQTGGALEFNPHQDDAGATATKAREWNGNAVVGQTTQSGETATPPAQQVSSGSATYTPDFIMQLGERIRVQVQKGGGEIRLQLRPENLGHLEIKAESGASGLVARIVTESGSVKHYLENNLHVLHQSMLDQGLKIDRIDIVLQEGFEARNFTGQHNSHHAGQQREEPRHLPDPQPATVRGNTEDQSSDSGNLASLRHHRGFHTVA